MYIVVRAFHWASPSVLPPLAVSNYHVALVLPIPMAVYIVWQLQMVESLLDEVLGLVLSQSLLVPAEWPQKLEFAINEQPQSWAAVLVWKMAEAEPLHL